MRERTALINPSMHNDYKQFRKENQEKAENSGSHLQRKNSILYDKSKKKNKCSSQNIGNCRTEKRT
jgi:hypothetical protein